jgi:hypothetical protein
MIKISSCVYQDGHRYFIGICHGVPANSVKLGLLAADLLKSHLILADINSDGISDELLDLLKVKHSDIQVIKNSIEMSEDPDEIIRQCFSEAFSPEMRQNQGTSNILEVIYSGDVNLTNPCLKVYPPLLTNQQEFSTMIKAYLPNCMLIKRILISAEQSVIDDAQQIFLQPQDRQDQELPLIIDSCINKSYVGKKFTKLYTEV